MTSRARRPGGTPEGGQFAPGTRRKSDLDGIACEPGARDDAGDVFAHWDTPDAPTLEQVAGSSAEQLDGYVRHPDPIVRADAATSPNLTSAQLRELASPDQPFVVRSTIALLPSRYAAELAAADHDPAIRHLVLRQGLVKGRTRDLLRSDPGVARVQALIGRR